MDILSAVDGTGPFSDAEYTQSFSNSFVRRMYLNWHTPLSYYDRGPNITGISAGDRAKAQAGAAEIMYRYVSASEKITSAPRLFLTGYSRGGAAALEAANTLISKGIPVHALLLFDAVDRSFTISKTTVPRGVAYCRHAIRSSATDSRTSFGNVGLKKDVSVDYAHAVTFFCTHGAMGGMPWKEAGPDGFIREWDEGSTKKTARIIKTVGRAVPSTAVGGYIGSRVLNESTKTNVTLAEERSNGLKVFGYMFGQLEQLKKQK